MMTASNENHILPFHCSDGLTVEAVYYGSGTLCISSQAGCAVGCPFCASGSRGLIRNLTLAEMAGQIDACRCSGLTPQRITISGIGEPLHNWVTVSTFLDLCQTEGIDVSITTTGSSLERLNTLLHSRHNGIMLSLHATDRFTHRRLLPHGPDFTSLIASVSDSLRQLSRRQRRRIGINYLLLTGVNDRDQDLNGMKTLLSAWPDSTLHLLSCNEGGQEGFATDPSRIDAWHTALTNEGLNVRRPNRWRTQREGGCGTLFIKTLNTMTGRNDG